MPFLYIITALTASLALFSLSIDFPYLPLLSIVILIGLGVSWWQQVNNKKILYLKNAVNLLLIILTVKALLPFFAQSSEILSGLIKTWAYFLALSTFTVYSKRDYYIIQTLSLGLVIFSCFSQAEKSTILLGYILGFFIIWIIGLRVISLLQYAKEIKEITQKKGWLLRELRIGTIFICVVIFLTLPIYLSLPRFSISLPILSRLIEQKYNLSYIDFPRNSLMSFLSPSEKKVTPFPGDSDGQISGIGDETSPESLIDLDQETLKLEFWHYESGIQGYENKLKELKAQIEQLSQEIEIINQQLSGISEDKNIPQLKELLEERKRLQARMQQLLANQAQLKRERDILEKEYFETVDKKTIFSLNEPENISLLEKLEQKIKAIEKEMHAKIIDLQEIEEDLTRTQTRIEDVWKAIYQLAMQTDVEKEISTLWAKREASEESLESLRNELKAREKNYELLKIHSAEQAKVKPEPEKKEIAHRFSLFNLLSRLLIFILVLMAIYLSSRLAISFLSYLKYKRKMTRALKEDYRLFIIIIYNFLCKILRAFGCKLPITITPEENLILLNKKFQNAGRHLSSLTALFIEARYSPHMITGMHAQRAHLSYLEILDELRRKGSFWQRIILNFG